MPSYRQPSALPSDNEVAKKDIPTKAIRSFVTALGCDFGRFPIPKDQALIHAAENAIREHVPSETHRQMLIKRLPVGLGVANYAYTTYPFDVRLFIGLYTTLFTYIDDAETPGIMSNLERFAMNFGLGASHSDPNLDYMAHLLAVELPKLWGPFTSSCIIKATMDLLSGCMLESYFPSGFDHLARGFPSYLRNKTGASEVYAFFIFPESLFPESEFLGSYVHIIGGTIEVTNAVNDIISYYKESVIGDEMNGRIVSEANVQMRQPVDVLLEVCRDAGTMHEHIKQKLGEADERLLRAYCSFVDGLSAFHVLSERYRLSEIGITIKDGWLVC
ncbi:hypothetical protein ASPBRDRAFT_191711 [Aspergillus brasiliensis CBS 101740]|uniref:Terpene synthase n=1 Tax=Aspergillus brasiliensis (strain CBS 101740 / IMI 381727 / IBT 21946) TaxID=767769 RepID=A0A1L9UV62_ASPBC|nr:hypothetical protein ASPBRDRAFT_191711 [Aspergillus brasiliensis CBS 101740]